MSDSPAWTFGDVTARQFPDKDQTTAYFEGSAAMIKALIRYGIEVQSATRAVER